MADFKLRVDHITYDATKKLDALKEELRPVKPIPPSPFITAEILRHQHQELMMNDALYVRNSVLNQSLANQMNGLNHALNMNLFNQINQLERSWSDPRRHSYVQGY